MDSCSRLTAKTLEEDGTAAQTQSVSAATTMKNAFTISTHGQGELVSGSVKVVADGPMGGFLRFNLPDIGAAGVGTSPPVRDVLFPARRQAGGINTGVALHNLEEEAMGVSCRRDSYQQLLAVPTDLLNTPAPLPDWRDVLGAADTVTEADIRNVYPGSADAAVAVFQRRRDYADRSVVLAHARADASTALTDALDAAQAAVADLEARNSVTRTALAQTQVAAALTRARLLVALSNLRSHEAAAQAADAYNAEVARRQIASRRLANRAALEAQWAEEQATMAAAADQRIQSMYGGFQIPDGLGGN